MRPGRELDALVAERVMGLSGPWGEGDYFMPCYSTSIADAWEVVEKLAQRFELYRDTCWEAVFNGKRVGAAQAETAPAAICLAALAAVGVTVDAD